MQVHKISMVILSSPIDTCTLFIKILINAVIFNINFKTHKFIYVCLLKTILIDIGPFKFAIGLIKTNT